MKTFSYLAVLVLLSFHVLGQNNHQQYESIDSVKHGSFNPNEAHSFHEWFKMGHVSGLFRSNFIQTTRPESSYFSGALAVGGRLYYHSAYWHGLQIGIGGIFTYNILSSELEPSAQDRYTPKWERQLFDLEDPGNSNDLDRLEELFIKYRFKDSYIRLGKMLLNTPLVNPQDSRMKPSAFQGVWLDWNEGHRFEINGGFFNKVSPRSTTEWINLSESIGLYDHLMNHDSLHQEVDTRGLAILGGHYIPNDQISFHSWQYYIDRISFTTFNQVELNKFDFKLGLQYLYQENFEQDHTTIENKNAHLMSGQIKWNKKILQISYNQTRSLSDNPLIFPAEWGAEPFYTFISRHRIEGLENINSRAIKFDLQPLQNWKEFNIGIYAVHSTFMQEQENTSLSQISLDLQTDFQNNWEELSLRLLNTYFIPDGYSVDNFFYEPIYHTQLILNYRF
jgi:hypothetical protein